MSAETSTGSAGSTAAARDFILPDLGEGLTEAELISWLVAVGDEVHVDQMVVEVESAKSVVELPCPYAGRVEALHAAAGDTVAAGQALLSVAEAGSAGPTTTESTEETAAASSGANLIGYGTSEPKTRSAKKRSFGAKPGRGAELSTPAQSLASIPVPPEAQPESQPAPAVSPVSSPIVRKLAKDNGLSAKHLPGSGPGGAVTRADVVSAIESGTTTPITREPQTSKSQSSTTSASTPAAPATSSASGKSSTSSDNDNDNDNDTRTPITGLRKVVSERLSKSRREIPEATIWLDVDATELLNTKRILEAKSSEKYSLLSLVSRFVIAGLKKHPIINSSIDTAANQIVTHGDINLGLAAQTPRGLMVPVVHGAGEMSLRQLRDSVSETVGKASTGKFSTQELTGGTFTLNNYGVFGVDGSAPIINLPEVAMLGLGRIKDRPWVVDGELTVRKVMFLSLVFDHRACDGEDPSRFLTFVADCIENPISLLPEL